MRPSHYLFRLERQALKRLLRVQAEIHLIPSSAGTANREARARIAYCAFELHGTWAHFARAYFISSMIGCKNASGVRIGVTNPVMSHEEAIGTAINLNTPKKALNKPLSGPWSQRDEPAWHSTQVWLTLLNQINCSGIACVNVALSIPTSVFSDLTKFRNYFAHRNEENFKNANNLALTYSISPLLTPSEILMSKPLGQPNVLLEQWVIDVENVIHLICS